MARRIKIRAVLPLKLTLYISVLIVLTSITLGWFFGRNAVELIKSGLMERGRSLARNLAYNGEYGVLIGSKELLTQLVDGVIREEDVLYAVIENEAGGPLAGSHSAQLARIPPRTAERTALGNLGWTDPNTRAYEINWGGELFYEITFPVKTLQVRREREEIGLTLEDTLGTGGAARSEKTIGLAAVGMSLSQKRVKATTDSINFNIALLTGLVILVGIGVTIFLVKKIVGPIKELAEAAGQIAEGDLHSHVDIKSRDEIGDLAASFNRMAEAIQQREGEARLHAEALDRLNRRLVEQQAELHETNEQLAAASQHKSQFLANMSHELRNPLNAIIGFSGILLNESLGKVSAEERQEFLGNIMTSGKHLLGLINEVLDLSRVEAGKETLTWKRFSVAEVLEGVRQTVEPLADKKQIGITMTIDPRLTNVTADEVKFKQILDNLLGNAIKFTPEGGHVQVRALAKNEWAEFSVTDNGIGIKPEDQARIFQEFERVEMTAERRFEGTGLGLTLAKKYVELHGGRIWLESEVGKGSTFAFVLPLTRSGKVGDPTSGES